MKTLTCGTLLVLLFAVATAAYAVPSMDVTVSDLQAKTARKISTKPDGTFAINGLRPGQYLVQFKARHALATNDRYLLILCAGEKTLISNAFPGKKLMAGGVAARMDVGAQKTLTGQVANATELERAKVRVVNGKRYIWSPGEVGSNLGGRWVEERSASAQHVVGLALSDFRKLQDHAGEGALNGNMHLADQELPRHH